MTKELVLRYGYLTEIHIFLPELKLRTISEYTGEMLTYDPSMNFRESMKM